MVPIKTLLLVAGLGFGALSGCGSDSARGPDIVGGVLAPTSSEAKVMLHLREEEKLARDVYARLHADATFANIEASEQQHFDQMGALVAAYGLADPAQGKAAGQFLDPDLQALHDALVAKSALSPTEALTVGAEIEELDIADLDVAIAGSTHADATSVYEQLQRGSRNHLRTFHGRLLAVGVTYAPKHLDAARYQAIVTSAKETGKP